MYWTSFSDGSESVVKYRPFLPCRAKAKSIWRAEQGLARARLSGDHVDGPSGEPAAEDAVEGGAARREALEDRPASRSWLLLPSGDDAPLSKLGDLRETIDDDRTRSAPRAAPQSSRASSRSAGAFRRVRGRVLPGGRDRVAVFEALPRDGERGQLGPAQRARAAPRDAGAWPRRRCRGCPRARSRARRKGRLRTGQLRLDPRDPARTWSSESG